MVTERFIQLENLTLGYERHPAVHHVTGQFENGCLTAVVGPNGAGKSTLLKGLSGALKPLEGRIRLNGISKSDIAFLPQQMHLDPSFPISVMDVVCMGHWSRSRLFGTITMSMVDFALAALNDVGLDGFQNRPAGVLSRGQMQRVLFARLLVQDAQVMLLDEPFTAIDEATLETLMSVVQKWHDEERMVIAVMHDVSQVLEHFPSALLLARECIAWGATKQVICEDNLKAARDISSSWIEDAAICERGEVA